MTGLREAIDLHGALGGELGATELCDLLRDLVGGVEPADRVEAVRPIKPPRVYRLELTGAPWRSVVLKRLEPAMAQRARLAAERWLPALGLGSRSARLLGVAAERSGDAVWHVYEDLGDRTLAARPAAECVDATVDLVAELHLRAARHPVLPDARHHGGGRGLAYFTESVGDAVAALETLHNTGIEPPAAFAGVPARLLERLRDLLADAPRRARVFADAAGPDTLLHGDLWPINAFVDATPEGPRARLVDWDRVAVGPFSYDLSTLLFRLPPAERPRVLSRYRQALARGGWTLPAPADLSVLCDTAERARYANYLIWPVLALVQERPSWGFPELAEVERWFVALDSSLEVASV
ncbi:MAG TPA: aminoglycoside phosphotransferase family protein [Gemmatimonadales bacterium]|nr:aminoglycoside phosphotransferase family protein [Gemmatimonadales bacterium]